MAIRDIRFNFDKSYFDRDIALLERENREIPNSLGKHPDPGFDAQHSYQRVRNYFELMLLKYSRGDDVAEIPQYFEPLIAVWEETRERELAVYTPAIMNTRTNFEVNLSHYTVCFSLVGLAYAFDLKTDLWRRLLHLIGNEGRDELFDRVVAQREPGRPIGPKLVYAKPYKPLLKAVLASPPKQSQLLKEFVDGWCAGLERSPRNKPYWWECHHGPEGGGYFGYWCVEAVAAVKAFGMDDATVIDSLYYPRELLHHA